MKKIFRMALVFALAGATLMYTGCTKDYSEDINKLDSEISSLENEYKALSDELASLKSGVANLEAAYKAADSALENKLAGQIADIEKNLNGKIAEIEKAIAQKADKAEVEAQIKALKDEALKLADELQAKLDAFEGKIDEKLAEAQKKLDEATAAFSNELRALVFVPDFYYDGVEATMYDFANFQAYDLVALAKNTKVTATNVDGAAVEFKTAGEKIYGIYTAAGAENKASEKVNGTPVYTYYNYTDGQLGKAVYDLNPSTFPVDAAEWSLKKDEKINLKAENKTWIPSVEAVEAVDGQIVVTYFIENPECLAQNLNAADGRDTLNLIQLNAITAEKNIASDWAAVFSSIDSLKHLVFAKDNKYTTENTETCKYQYFPPITGSKILYAKATDAIAKAASIQWQYNAGPLDLAKAIKMHLNTFEGVQELSLEELNARYPGFTMNFEAVPYYVGNSSINTTPESEYGELTEAGVFTPCYVKSEAGKSSQVVIEKDSEDKLGISAVGRRPMVLVTLNDESGKTFLAGYFIIEIVKEAKQADTRFFDVPSFGKVPFICALADKATSWHEFSYFVLEQLGVDYAEFIDQYKWEGVYGYEQVLDPTDPQHKKTMEKFVKIQLGNTSGEAAVEPAASFPQSIIPSYGTVTYNKNTTGSTVNDAFTWAVDAQKIGAGKSKTLYLRFANGKYDVVYFALNAEVAPVAELDFNANKISNEWYEDIDGESKNTVRINVPVPDGTVVVTNFKRDLDKFYIGQKPVTLSKNADECYAPYFDGKGAPTSPADVALPVEYYFSEAQPAINGIQLYTNIYDATNACTILYGPTKSNGQVVMDEFNIPSVGTVKYPKYNEDKKVAEIDPATGEITYFYAADAKGDFAKELLNLWSYTETDQAKMLYANVDIIGSYDNCKIAPQGDNFHVRFIRPLDVKFEAQDVAEESAVAGFNVEIAKFISGIVDWNHQNVIVPEMTTVNNKEVPTGYYIANKIKGIDMYAYYQFTKIVVDLDNAKRDHVVVGDEAKQVKMIDVYNEQRLFLGTIDANDVFTAGSGNEINITDFSQLKGAALNYKNTSAAIETFNIFVPVKIYYSWGTLNATLEINVKPTSETSGK